MIFSLIKFVVYNWGFLTIQKGSISAFWGVVKSFVEKQIYEIG